MVTIDTHPQVRFKDFSTCPSTIYMHYPVCSTKFAEEKDL